MCFTMFYLKKQLQTEIDELPSSEPESPAPRWRKSCGQAEAAGSEDGYGKIVVITQVIC